MARSLAADGYAVTGVDIDRVHVERARRLVPSATFVNTDATRPDFGLASSTRSSACKS